jgi:transposase InsO family protein
MVSPARRRAAVAYLLHRFSVSERRACEVVGQHRSTQRYEVRPADFELRLVARMNELADRHPRYGYRRVWALLRSEGWEVNHKRVRRLWVKEGHRVPPAKRSSSQKAKGSGAGAAWNLPATAPNDVWSYDFLEGRTSNGGPIRILNVVDEYTRRGLGSLVARSIGARGVAAHLERLFERHGRPKLLRSDNGREFIAETLGQWLQEHDVQPVFIEYGSPWQNPFVERFNRTMRDEVLNGESFHSVLEARVVLGRWLHEYNTLRPHRGLGMKTPQAFYNASRVGSPREEPPSIALDQSLPRFRDCVAAATRRPRRHSLTETFTYTNTQTGPNDGGHAGGSGPGEPLGININHLPQA